MSVKVVVSNIKSRIIGQLPLEVFQQIDLCTSYKVPNYWFSTAYKIHKWDGRKRLLQRPYNIFPTGLLRRVLKVFDENDIWYSIQQNSSDPFEEDKREVPKLKSIELRDYQVNSIKLGLEKHRGIFSLPTGSGKCVTKDTLVHTKDGLVTIGSLEPKEQVEKQFCEINTEVLGRDSFRRVSHFYANGRSPTLNLVTREGFEIEGTLEHPVLTMRDSDNISFKKLHEIEPGDYVCIDRKRKTFGRGVALDYKSFRSKHDSNSITCNLPKALNQSLCKFLAYILAEGTTTQPRDLVFTNTSTELINDLQAITKELFNTTWKQQKKRIDYNLCRVQVRRFLAYLGIDYVKAKDKEVPWPVLKGTKENIRAFLKTLFDCEATIGKYFEMSTASEKLCKQLQILLLGFGIISRRWKILTKSPSSGIRRPYWRLEIYGKANLEILEKEIDFSLKSKQSKLRQVIASKKRSNSNIDTIPFQAQKLKQVIDKMKSTKEKGGWASRFRKYFASNVYRSIKVNRVTYSFLNEFLQGSKHVHCKERVALENLQKEHLYFSRVKSITKRVGATVDITVPTSQSFVSNGFISHNTAVAIAIIKALDLKTLWLTHRKELFQQSKDFLNQYVPEMAINVGIVGEGRFEPKKVTVAMVPTLYSRRESNEVKQFFSSIQVLVLDECHRSAADTWYHLANRIPAHYRLGLSGTPLLRSDNKNLLIVAATGEVLYSVSSDELVKRDLLKKPTVTFVSISNTAEGDNYEEVYDAGIVFSSERNDRIIELVKKFVKQGRSTLVLVRKIQHGKILQRLLTKSRVTSRFIWGGSASLTRQYCLSRFKQGKLPVLVASTILDEGVDVKNIHALILAGAGKSKIKALQRVGRGMRPDVWQDLQVVDFADLGHSYLRNHSLERLQVFKREGFTIKKST